MKRALGGRRVSVPPERIAFGLPQRYYLSTMRDGCTVRPSEHARRASPLVVHVHAPGALGSRQQTDDDSEGAHEGVLALVVSFLPGTFLPDEERLAFCRAEVDWDSDDFWQPIHHFLDRLVDDEAGREPFGRAYEVAAEA
jgi:hypothetical protein